jgi:catechol 2,3-dioxygenase-like lactoylglutathione lyase family enzyme
MKRMHVHVAVDDLDRSVGFYSTLFGASPTVLKPDYAKWMLDDPRVNFAISTGQPKTGLDHLGIQVESDDELREVADRASGAGIAIAAQPGAQCCYAASEKAWVVDPQGIAWETFHTTGEITTYGEDGRREAPTVKAAACCATPKPSIEVKAAASGCCGAAAR